MGPKILIFDIETSPLLIYRWSLWRQDNAALNQLHSDWFVLAWAAKWIGKKSVIYRDQRKAKNIEDDKAILTELWQLLDEADIVVGQNVRSFDAKKVNARFAIHGLKPPSPYKIIDTKELARKHFEFTSAGLEYLSDKLCKKYKKLKHKRFPGFELWKECLRGNPAAWREMERYNKHDVLATEELYQILTPWGSGNHLSSYRGEVVCDECGSENFEPRGVHKKRGGWFKRFRCRDCGHWFIATGEKNNLMPKELRERIKNRQKAK